MGLTVHLFGSVHIDNPTLIRSELESFCDRTEATALFLESSPESIPPRKWLYYLFRTPLLIIGLFAYSLLLWSISALLSRTFETVDVAVARNIANERGLSTYEVDPQSELLCSHGGYGFVALNWVGFLGSVLVLPQLSVLSLGALFVGVGLVSSVTRLSETLGSLLAVPIGVAWLGMLLLGYASWVILAGALVFVITARRTVASRNQEIVEKITEIGERDGIDNGVLVVGRTHLDGISDLVGSRGATWTRSFFRSGESL